PEFLSWIRLLYKKPVVHLLFNGPLGPLPLGAMLRARPNLSNPLKDKRDALVAPSLACPTATSSRQQKKTAVST
ncbi:hypothetical protein SDRG_04002, partial [Saprolegnia diclina VS20]